MTDPSVPAAVRLRAAESVFDRAIKGIELEDVDARLTALEQQLRNRTNGDEDNHEADFEVGRAICRVLP
jgi:hypothetical protein